MKIFIVIAVHNRKEHTLNCLRLLAQQSYSDFKVILVDDGSSDGTEEEVKLNFPETIIIRGKGDWWWSKSMNKGFKLAVQQGADVIVSLNNDVLFQSNFLESLLDLHCKNPKSMIGCINTLQKNQKYIFFSGIKRIVWWKAKEIKYHSPFSKYHSALSGLHKSKCLNGRGTLIPVSVFNKIGYFDEQHFPQYASDYDFSYRASKKGVDVQITWDIEVQSLIESTGEGRSFITQSWRHYLATFFNPYASTSIKMWWHYYRKHAGLFLLTGLGLQLLRLVFAFYNKRNQLEELK